MGKFDELLKLISTNIEKHGDDAAKILDEVSSPELAVALKGKPREKYLKALDNTYGDQTKRAADMGFGDDVYYHGSFRHINEFNPKKGNPEGFLGRSVYLTNNPADASYNYADKDGQDVANKIERLAEYFQNEKDMNYTAAKELAEKKVAGRVDSGAVYPLRTRVKNTADLSEDSSQWIDLNHKYDDDGELIEENPLVQQIMDSIQGHAEEPLDLFEDVKPRKLTEMVKGSTQYAEDDAGNLIGSEVARKTLHDIGFDSAKIKPKEEHFKNMPNIDHDTEHLMVFEPEKIRSVHAAYDPRFKKSGLIMAGAGAVPMTDNFKNPLDYIKDAASAYETTKNKILKPVANQMDLTKDKSTTDDIQSILSAVVDPVNLVNGPVGLGLGAAQMLGTDQEKEAKQRALNKLMGK